MFCFFFLLSSFSSRPNLAPPYYALDEWRRNRRAQEELEGLLNGHCYQRKQNLCRNKYTPIMSYYHIFLLIILLFYLIKVVHIIFEK